MVCADKSEFWHGVYLENFCEQHKKLFVWKKSGKIEAWVGVSTYPPQAQFHSFGESRDSKKWDRVIRDLEAEDQLDSLYCCPLAEERDVLGVFLQRIREAHHMCRFYTSFAP